MWQTLDKGELIDVLNDLVKSPGWSYLTHRLRERKALLVATLLSDSSTPTMEKVRYLQAAVREIDYLLRLPDLEMKRLAGAASKEEEV